MLTGVAHTGVCVPDVTEAVAWYESVLGMRVLSPPYLMSGADIERDMGELIPGLAVKAAILGFADDERVLEVIEYPGSRCRARDEDWRLTDVGFSHVGLVCDDIATTRADLEAKGVEFLVSGIAGIAGLRTTWFRDPWGLVFILMEKGRTDRPYYRQFGG